MTEEKSEERSGKRGVGRREKREALTLGTLNSELLNLKLATLNINS